MSIFASMTTAVTGLTAQTRSMGAISDNLANQTTVGYKRVNSQFQSMITASSTSAHSPGGVRVTPLRDSFLQGSIQQSSVPTNIAINGDGYFYVGKAVVRNDGQRVFEDNYFTRAGDFVVDKDGYLINSAGYYLYGNRVNPGTLATDPEPTPIRVNRVRDQPLQTTEVKYSANLPANPAAINDIDLNTPEIQFSPTQTSVYDPLGSERKLTIAWETTGTPGVWRATVTLGGQAGVDLNGNGPDTPLVLDVGFNTVDDPMTAANEIGTLSWIAPAPAAAPFPVNPHGDLAEQAINVVDASGANWSFNLNLGRYHEVGGLTQFASDSIDMSKVEQNGVPLGSLKSVTFNKDGYLTLNYDNGRSVPAYRVPLAMFSAPHALDAESGTAFRPSWESGLATMTFPGGLSSGEIVPTSVEMSNVDIGEEFSKMIVSQRTYSANTKMLSASDEMLQEILGVVR